MLPDAGPVSRALLALEMIQAAPGITAERIGERLGVSERAARRYVGMLREAGIAIESTRGPYGGYRAGRGLRLPPLLFSGTEALGLVMAVLDGHHPASDPTDPVGSALGKLVRALPEPVAATAEAVRRTASAAPDRGAARPDPTFTATLVQACADHRLVRVSYRSEAGTQWTTEAEPWAIVVRHGRWYLLCRTDHGVRTYRVDRVTEATVLEGGFRPPAGLDPVATLEENLGAGWEFAAEVVVDAAPDLVRRRLPPTLGRVEALPDGRSRVLGSTSNPEWYVQQLADAGGPFHVVGGEEVRAAARTLGRRLLDAVGDRGPADRG